MGIRDYFKQRAVKKKVQRHTKAKARFAKHEEASRKLNQYEIEVADYKAYLKEHKRIRQNPDNRKAFGLRNKAPKRLSFKEFRARKGTTI